MKKYLLATTCVVALTGGASAADLPLKAAAPAYIPVSSWTGPYIGAHVGVARMNATATNIDPNSDFANAACGWAMAACSQSDTGIAGGVEIGYDWQHRYFVYGVAADWTWTDLDRTQTRSSGTTIASYQAKVEWLASFRGRAGLAVDDTLVYLTGGLALAQVQAHNSVNSFRPHSYGSIDTTKVGWVAGAGVEHKFDPRWSAKAEFLYYDLGRESGTATNRAGNYTTEFHHEVLVGRMGVNYRF